MGHRPHLHQPWRLDRCNRTFIGVVQVRDFFQRVQLSPIDTYFMIDCVNGGKVPEPVDPSRMDPTHKAG